ncbi:MAG TPA: ATP-binding cassette domain-containing protein [bacterium]|jgi:energy-coupling factor transport system ATP-binding protein|nr:ATP-binding cassette domain-containing protein [bacterium]HOZ21948.1 ATP-binding cassette domain-containing protein [bacterium]
MSVDLQLRDLSFRYTGIGASDRMVLDRITLDLGGKPGCTAIVGPSGSGKTTLIQHFTGLLRPVSGTVRVDGEDIWSKGFDHTLLRRRIGLVFQFPEGQLFEETVARDIAFGPLNLGWPAERIEAAVEKAMRQVRLDAGRFRERSPFNLSEGEKRRVAIAGVLAMEPEMVVLDEPTAGLDPRGLRGVEELIEGLLDQGTAVVLITHNMDFVNDLAGRVLVMINGCIAFDGRPAELFADRTLLEAGSLEQPLFVQERAERGASWPAHLRGAGSLRALLRIVRK